MTKKSNNRAIGHRTERNFISKFAERLGLVPFNAKNHSEAEIGSTRQFSQQMDAMKIDVWFSPKLEWLKNLLIQIKNRQISSKKTWSVDISALKDMPKNGLRAVVTRLTYKPNKRQSELGWFVTMPMEDWMDLISKVNAYELSNDSSSESKLDKEPLEGRSISNTGEGA